MLCRRKNPFSHSPSVATPTATYQGSATTASPFGRVSKALQRYSTVKQPNHLQTVIADVDVDGEQHLVKFSRYYDNAQFWTVPGERDERLQGRKTVTVTEPEPEEYELYDLSNDRGEEHNLAEEQPERVRNLDDLIDLHLAETSALVPRINPHFSAAATPPRR